MKLYFPLLFPRFLFDNIRQGKMEILGRSGGIEMFRKTFTCLDVEQRGKGTKIENGGEGRD